MAYKEGRTARKSKPETAAFSYELFELAQTLRIRPRTDSIGGSDAQRHGGSSHLPFIQLASWHEDAFGSLLVLLCSNGALLVWSKDCAGNPFTKQISWYQNPSRAIKAICLDPSGCWLVCACMDTHLYIVPLSAAIKTEGRKSVSNCPWAKDDITKVLCSEKRAGLPCSVAWWHTADDFNMCIVGTELGEVVFVDLCNGKAILSVDLKEGITSLEMMQDKQHQSTCVMISTVSGEAWQLILESTSLPRRRFSMSSDPMTSPSVASALGYEMIGMMAIPLESFQAVTEWQDRLNPMPVKSAVGETHFSVQHARKQVFIGAHNLRTDILQVYDTDVAHLPMFIYQLRASTSKLVLTDRLLFTVVQPEQDKMYLSILSSQLAETSMSPPRQQRTDSSIIQTFVLPSDEQIVSLFKHSTMMDAMCAPDREEPLPNRVYAVDGCVLVTSSGVYECRPRISPEELFLDLAVHNKNNTAADMLAIISGLDVNLLYQIAAERALQLSKYEHAMKLYQLSKCPFHKRVAQFAKHGRIGDILTHLRQVLNKHSDFHTAERKQLSDFTMYCFVQQIMECSTQPQKGKELSEAFSQFINDNFDYDESFALELLSIHGLKEHIFDLAKARGLMSETLDMLNRTGQMHLSSELLHKLASRGFTDVVSRSSHGAFLYCMDPKDAVGFLLAKPETILSHLKFLMSYLVSLEEESLLHIARVLDPSRPSFRSLVAKLKTPRRRTMSSSSIASMMSLESTVSFTMDDSRAPSLADVLHVFLCCLMVLNSRRESHRDPTARMDSLNLVINSLKTSSEQCGRKREGTVEVQSQRVRLSCGQHHTAVVSASGDVYTWGKSHKGRLGHGDLIEEEGKSMPFRVEILHMHRIKVLSVACGIEHTLALCRDGVYSWGSSEYGQLGQGDTQQHTRPVYVTELSDKKCIAVVCGHYHSLALSADQQVYSWGWGVHGQLGLDSIEDALLPSHVTSLSGAFVTQLAAGYSHTAVLTTEGKVYTFGGGLYGQLGLGTTSKQTLPQLVQALEKDRIYLICCGSFETVAVSSEQKLFNWGRSPHYFRFHMRQEFRVKRSVQTKSGSLSHRLLPVQMDTSFPSPIKEIHCGNWHYLAVTEARQVFTWGFNDHGQLGHSTSMDHLLFPTVVQKLNESFVATASVGAEFSVAMDATGQVWVWGRSDSGQLGLDAGMIGSGKKEVTTPTLLSSLPVLNRVETNASSESLHSSSEEIYDVDWKLPDLSHFSGRSVTYGRESLSIALNSLFEHYSPRVMIRHCMDIEDNLSLSIIYDKMGQWSQALGIRLRYLNQQQSDTSTLLEPALPAIEYSLRNYVSTDFKDSKEENDHLTQMLKEVLGFWKNRGLAVTALENLLSDFLENVAYPLSLLIIREEVLHKDKTREVPQDCTTPPKLLFGSEFMENILEILSRQIHSGEKGGRYLEDVLEMTADKGDLNSNAAEQVKFNIGEEEDIPATEDQLIQKITDNIKKDLEKSSFINLSVPTAAMVAAAAASQLRDWQNENPMQSLPKSSPDVVTFTCNHHFPRIYFMGVILPEFQQRMSELVLPLVQTTKTLLAQYKKTESLLLAACPVCVYNSLRVEQLERLPDTSSSNGTKTKFWEI
ncbi:uncharacterized protein LOC5517399 isoform X2 [Nematostella vectensis]|uniref:uncharacterized protein LOC5517399 isoform X2 n=1 Tax=Nematostella vectensis TaxID=45351 RepID=UPI0020775207|nr:uncharacterized protein LOC5517399 isoform X2 [Nematostella vectensis]